MSTTVDEPSDHKRPSIADWFNRAADWFTRALGSLSALIGSVVLVVVWAATGPIFRFSDTWQLFINTTTTVITFWMVFVIQNSANREARATQLKLDEIIRAISEARNEFTSLEHASEEVLAEHEEEMTNLVKKSRETLDVATGLKAQADGEDDRRQERDA